MLRELSELNPRQHMLPAGGVNFFLSLGPQHHFLNILMIFVKAVIAGHSLQHGQADTLLVVGIREKSYVLFPAFGAI